MAIREEFRIDPGDLRKDLQTIEREIEASAKRQTKTISQEGAKAGQEMAAEMVKAFSAERKKRKGKLKEDLALGLIDKREFRRLGREIDREINDKAVGAMKKLERQGKLTTDAHAKLSGAIRTSAVQARRAGEEGARGASRWRRGLSRIKDALFSMKGLVAGVGAFFAGRALAGFFGRSIKVAEEGSQVWSRLKANVENAGVAFAEVRPEIEAAARAVQDSTRFGDEDYAAALAELVSTTGDYAGSLAEMNTVLDFAVAKNVDLATAAKLVGRAMIGDTSTLKRYGVIVQENADAMEVLRSQFAGAAEEEGQKLSGRLARLRNNWADVKQAVGEALLENEGAANATDTLAEALVRLESWIKTNVNQLNRLAAGAINAGGAIGRLATSILDRFDPAGAVAREEIASAMQLRSPEALQERRFALGQRIRGLDTQLPELRQRARLFEGAPKRAAQQRVEEIEAEIQGLQEAIVSIDALMDGLERKEQRLQRSGAGGLGELFVPRRDLQATGALGRAGITLFEGMKTSLPEVRAGLDLVADALERVRQAETAVVLARNQGDPEATAAAVRARAEAEEMLRDRVREVAAAILPLIKDEQLRARVMKELAAALGDVTEEQEAQAESWRDTADVIEGVARGVLSVVDAAGDLSDELRRVLQGVIDIASGVQAIDFGDITSAASLGGLAQLAGGVVSFVGGLFGGGGEEEAERRRQEEEMLRQLRENAQRIRENTRALVDFRTGALSDLTGEERAQMLELGLAIQAQLNQWVTAESIGRALGMTEQEIAAFLEELEQTTGASFFDPDTGHVDPNEYRRALGDFQAKDLGLFDETVLGRVDALTFKWGLMGDAAGTAAERLQEFIDTLAATEEGAAFARRLQEELEDGGPEAARALLRAWAKQLASADPAVRQALFDAGGAFYNLTPDEVEDLLQEGNALLEEMLDGAGGPGETQVQIARSITEFQAVEVVALLEDIGFTLRDQLSELRGIHRVLAGVDSLGSVSAEGAPLPQVVSAGASGPSFDFRGSTFTASAPEAEIDRWVEEWARVMKAKLKGRQG